jgi:hypothetical protein
MGLQADINAEPELVRRISTVARRSSCPAFLDLHWPPCPGVLVLWEDPGVLFESPRRQVVFQRIEGELRYYAGGWCPDQARIFLEQDRIAAEGGETGVFASVADALAFAEQYLVEERGLAEVLVPRKVRHARDCKGDGAEPPAAADRSCD